MFSNHRHKIIWIIALTLIAVLAGTQSSQAQSGETDDVIAPIVAQIEVSGQYDFTAQIEQTLIPRPIPSNIGTTEQRIDTQMTGRVVLPDYAQINLLFEVSGDVPPITIEQDGADVYLIQNGERTQIENPLSIAPTTDFLGYMHAAANVRINNNPEQPQLTIYEYEIDGAKFSDYAAATIRRQLPPEQQTTPLVLPPALQQMTGHRELWVDAKGYPQRQILDITSPEVNEQFDVQSHIVIDFFFDTAVTGLPLITADNVLPTTSESPSVAAPTGPQPAMAAITTSWTLASFLWGLLGVVVLLILTIYVARSPRWLRVAMPIGLVAIMILTPILQPVSYAHALKQEETALPTLNEALGLAETEAAAAATTSSLNPAPLQPETLTNTITCGTGNINTDSDLDGTNDFVENCLGTNPYLADTDFDGITDTLEIEGFVFTNTASITNTFYSNPLEYDTNQDGLDDRAEWLLPAGTANALDPDGDDIPNLWDDDNDGDGVGDEEDIDPFTVSAYQSNFAIRTGLNGSSFDGYQYIQFQVQPQDQSHFQLVTTELDWPYDDRGTIQARDTTRPDEVTFSPMLKVTTNNAPEDFLQEMYGITVVQQGNNTVMYIDLAPVSDGGRITAFQGKVAYAPWELADINWSKVEFVWTVMMKHSPVNETDNTKYVTIPIAEYAESNFRFAGLEVTKSGAVEYAVIGTPAAQSNHRELVNLLAGLEGSYLNTLNPDFDTLVSRLSTPTTPITETWGVPVADIAIGLPSMQPHHLDEIMARPFDSYTTVSNFLNSNGYNLAQMASVIIAMEAKTGADSLDSGTAINGNTFTFNLAQIPVATMRTVTLSHYKHNGTRWDDMPDLDAINSLIANYPGDPNAVLANLQQVYPDLTAVDLANALFAFYMVWANGRSAIVSFDDLTVVAESEPLEPLNQQINLPLITDTLAYLMNAYQLGVVGGSVVFNDPVTYQQYASDYSAVPGGTNVAIGFMIASGAFNLAIDGWRWFSLAYWGGNAGFRSIQLAADGYSSTARWLFGAEKVVAASKPENLAFASHIVIDWTPPVKKVSFMVKLSKRVGNTMVKYSKLMAKIGRVIGIITFGISIALIWVNYAKFSSPYTYEKTYAAIYATLDTLFTTLSFIIGLTGFGSVLIVIFLILDLVGLIITTIAGVPQDSIVTTAISKLIADIQPHTTVYSVDFDGVSVSVNGNGYTVAGSTVTLSDKFEGTLSGYLNEDIKYLVASDIYGTMQARAGANIVADAGNDVSTNRFRCHINGGYKDCANRLWADYTFANAGRDQKVEFFYEIVAKTQYVQESLGGLIAKDKEDVMYLPSELREADRWGWIPVYIDVLPNTLDGLLNWSELSNNDLDGDDIDNVTEAALTSYPADIDGDGLINSRDADRDGDDLSDTFETISQNSLGTDPNNPDSDGDGLNDGLEWQINSNIKLVDSDNDGLSDSEEVFHWNGSAWTGGGWFMTIDGQSYWVFADPTAVDRDRDHVNDASEKLNGTSPNAVNDAPRLELTASPLITTPFGASGIYVKAGDVVTSSLRLYNTGASVINDTLTFCVPSALSNVNVMVSGDRIPATQQNGNCYAWDFSGNNLLLFQQFNVYMSALATGSTVTDTLSATLPYNISGTPSPISLSVPFVQDNTSPAVQITEPMSNTILTSQFYVMGGYAQDTTSWLDHVEVTVPAGTFEAALSDARWGYTWELPADGLITVSAVAYDALGNASSPASVQVLVDTLAPNITINLANGATISAGESYSTTIPLNGTVTDNFAGVARVQLRYNRGPWRTIWDDANYPLSTNWDGLWELPTTDNAQGEHTIYLRAYDAYGNVGTITRTVFIDVLPPTNELTNRAFVQETPNHVPGGQSVPLYGVASDAGNNPLPADPAELSGNLNSIADATIWLQIDNLSENDGGVFVTWLGDINGDRLGDLAVGLPGANGGTGKVVVVNGRPGAWPIPTIGELEFLQENTPSYIGTAGAGIGAIMQSAGDVNGDGLDDMLIGDPANNRVILILGTAGNGVHEQELNGQAPRQIEIVTQAAGESLSTLSDTQLAGVGDVNNDGLSDIMVTVDTATGSRVYLLVGGTPLLTPQGLDTLAAAAFETSSAGASVAGVGDIDHDFIPDFAIATNNTVYLFAGGGNWAKSGLTTLTTANAIATFATADSLPTIVGTGDLNGDGIDDFAFTNGSSPIVVFGHANQNFTTQTLGGFGSPLSGFLAAVGDVDKDGRGDLLIGNANDDAYLILGSNLGSAAATIAGVATAASTPYVAGADLAGDGSSDLAVVPTAAAAAALGYNGFVGQTTQAPFISRTSLPEVNGAAANQPASHNIQSENALLPGDVTVGAVGADFTSIQTAIDSGASRVLIQPGIYAEVITLSSNVTVIGSGADRTIITFPGGAAATTLVTANGISNSAVLNLTLLGDGSGTGLSVTNGATNIRLDRTVVQGMATAVAVNNSTSSLALKNNTLVGNGNGFVASGNAGVDIRNTLFAYNTGTALQYDAGAVLQLHQYNLYYANGTDLTPNNPGGGELFSDPLFLDYANGDFRTESFSPVVDAGTPNDPVPPGAGTAIDIGHREQTSSSFFVDDNYCDVCTNDGLIWGVDAFATIQDAVNAAQADIANLQLETPIQFTVGVNDGIYTESVVISSSVQLLGRAPDQTTIQGVSGPAMTFDAAANAGVSGFTLIGGGATPIGILMQGGSNTLAIDYNLIKNNTIGISVTQRSTGNATFNTIISNTIGVQLGRGTYFNTVEVAPGVYERQLADTCYSIILCEERGYLWLDMAYNIISGNNQGLAAIGKSVLFSDYNLLYNTADYTNVVSGMHDIIGQNPLLITPNGYLQVGSPAVDQATPNIMPPAGGGLRADLGWHELLAAPISVLMGQPDESLATESIGVGQVEYAVVPVADPTAPITATLPTTWTVATLDDPGAKLTYWQTNYNAAADGYYRVYSRATDVLGNTETEVTVWYDGAFVVDSNTPIVTMTLSPGLVNNWLVMEAQVTDYIGDSFDIDEVYFTMDGQRVNARWAIEEWVADGASPRTFRYFFQNNTGVDMLNVNIQAFATDGAGNVGSSAIQTVNIPGSGVNQWIDTIPPRMITITTPLPGTYVTDTVTFTGLAWDNGAFFSPVFEEIDSQTMGIELSFDGGVTWQAANSWKPVPPDPDRFIADRKWEYTWTIPTGLDATTIPVRVRATDNAGNFRSEMITITLDTAPPRAFTHVFNLPEGIYMDKGEVITGDWGPSLDGSGWVTGTSVVENSNGTISLFPNSDYHVEDSGSEGTPVGFRFGVRDESGNVVYDDFGIWKGGDVAGRPPDYPEWAGFQYLERDGYLDINHNEWLTATEFLDNDERPDYVQSLWTTWDTYSAYVGWQGASWGPDGTLWLYFDLFTGGSNIAIGDGRQLPFEADFAVSAVDADTAYFWHYESGSNSWLSELLSTPDTNPFQPDYSHDPLREETEIRVLFVDYLDTTGTVDWNRMFAYTVNPDGAVTSAFPTVNNLNSPFGYYYEWDSASDPYNLLELPTAVRKPAVSLSVTSNPPVQDTVTINQTIIYVASISTLEDEDEASIQMMVNGSSAVAYQTVEGAAAYDCSAILSCVVDLPTIPAGGTQVVTITAIATADLAMFGGAFTSIQLTSDVFELPNATIALTHDADITVPTVTIGTHPGKAIGTGTQTVFGTADDGIGAGVATVEVSTDGVNWQLASGTQIWSANITAPSGPTWTLYARATDYHNQTSAITMTVLVEDTTAPLVTATVPSLVGGSSVTVLNGATRDPAPTDATVAIVATQLDHADAPWRNGILAAPQANGEQSWLYVWPLPAEDGVTHTIRFRATDHANNETMTGWFTTMVDTIAPTITVTQQLTQVVSGSSSPVLAGTVSDGTGVMTATVELYPQSGAPIADVITLNGNQWSYVISQPVGQYTAWLRFVDMADNRRVIGPFAIAVVPNADPIAVDDTGETDEDTAVILDVLGNDSDPNGDILTIDSLTQPPNGVVSNNGTNVTYTPTLNFNGTDVFTYTISDGNGGQDSATVTVTVNPINDNPVANDDSAITDEDTAVMVDVLSNDTDVDGDTLTIDSVMQGNHGVAAITGSQITFTPTLNFNGTDVFTYTINDGNGGSDTALVTITIDPVNDDPVAVDDSAATDEETSVTIDVLSNDTDVDGDVLTVDFVTQGGHGTVVNNGVDVTYTPDSGFSGSDSFTYTISDGNGGSDTAIVTVQVASSPGTTIFLPLLLNAPSSATTPEVGPSPEKQDELYRTQPTTNHVRTDLPMFLMMLNGVCLGLWDRKRQRGSAAEELNRIY